MPTKSESETVMASSEEDVELARRLEAMQPIGNPMQTTAKRVTRKRSGDKDEWFIVMTVSFKMN